MKRDLPDINTPEHYDELWFGPRTAQLGAHLYAIGLLQSLTPAGGRVLDVGCGVGRYFPAFDGATIYGSELSPKARDQARRDHPEARLFDWRAGDRLPFGDNFFGLVWAGEFLEHIDDPGQAVAEFYRVTAPGGVIVLLTPFGKNSQCDEHLWFFDRNEILALCEPYRLLAALLEWKLVGILTGKDYGWCSPDDQLPDEVKFQIILRKP